MELQVAVSEMMSQFAELLPFGYAFGAGMVSAVNPCGFFLLPVYMSLYLGAEESDFQEHSLFSRIVKAGWIAVVVTAGFGLLFVLVGSVVSAGGYFLMGIVPWFAVVVGVLLTALGIWLLLGHTLSFPLIAHLANKMGDPRDISTGGFFLFGVTFAITSLGCTLPIFLAVVGSAVTTGDVLNGLARFVSYILGTGFVLFVLILGIALVKKRLVVGTIKRLVPYVHKISAIFLLTAGVYILYYWLSSGLLLGS
ncbi:cytochrome c biogenesis CcdA family protein [Desulfopila sp. IMCC35008]|uniref:cytochrome c biogenesis CcdA family protein n=1 Tax=Desulfopila sp. IMCC35008 TaxID=2653858 RepID=UPI0013D6A778|nr:cytochrome c biogenesis protein CcdA [Desulfopila sp. IMCC35008]